MDDIKIPQIKPKNNSATINTQVANTDTPSQSSVLTPNPLVRNPTLSSNQSFSTNKLGFFEKMKLSKFSLPPKRTLIIIASILIALLLLIGLPIANVYVKAMSVVNSGKRLSEVVKSQDLVQVKNEIQNTKEKFQSLNSAYKLISWTKFIPFFGAYSKDAQAVITAGVYSLEAGEITLSATEPYLDILGFGSGEQATDGAKTTEDRIDFFVKAIPDLIPKISDISQKLTLAQKELEVVNPSRYPVKFGKRQIREPLAEGLNLFNEVTTFVVNSKPLLEVTPYLLGLDEGRRYLVLFQNDKELRPTGGFMTAYSIMEVQKAKFEPISSDDIYNLDAKYKPSIAAPDPIIKYIKGPYVLSPNLRLRDLNWSPDFYESMKVFTQEAQTVGVEDIDGIIAVDTQVVVYLLDALGKIGVPGFGNFSTEVVAECNCPQVIYELESFADVEGPIVWDPAGTGKIIYAPPNYLNRKKIVGPLMNSILANALGQPKEKLPGLFEAAFKSVIEKHVLFYMFDDSVQKGLESFGIAGRVKEYDGDYLHINDANLGGRKSNLYVKQDVHQEVSIARDGTVEKTVTITYKNPEKHDGWLNSVLPNWVRLYVPKGSELIDMEGLEERADPYEDLGKTVFAGYFELRPEGVSKVTFKYKLPFKVSKNYNLFVQKQAGVDAPLYTIKVGRNEEEMYLKQDKEFRFQI